MSIGAASGGALGVGSNILRPGQQIVHKPEALLQFQTASNLDLAAQLGANNSNSGPSLASRSAVTGESIPGQPDPYTFDVVGLKLGMTAQQASNAITARVPSITKSTFEPGSPQFTSTAHFTSGFSARASNFSVLLVFIESYPFDPKNPERLSSIFYTAVTPTQTDHDRFEQQALTKYGPPVSYQEGIGARWCNQGTAAGSARRMLRISFCEAAMNSFLGITASPCESANSGTNRPPERLQSSAKPRMKTGKIKGEEA